ncbi:MAG: cytochrome [Spirosoma sp.]|nr:cytochrome [Spirosoma sp.]
MIRLWSALAFLVVVSLLSCQSDEELQRQRYITEGILLYKNNCANCHQTNGEGLASLYPPLAGSDYLADKNSVICLIRYGQQGPIVVNGKRYNRPMPAQAKLSDLEIAELTTYLYNKWGRETTVTGVKAVTPVLNQCKNRL